MTPRPGETRLHNLVATLMLHGNRSHALDLRKIAKGSNVDLADLTALFTRAETEASLTPANCVIPEGE